MRTEIDLEKEFPYIMADERSKADINKAYSDMNRGYENVTSRTDVGPVPPWEEFIAVFIGMWSPKEATAKERAEHR